MTTKVAKQEVAMLLLQKSWNQRNKKTKNMGFMRHPAAWWSLKNHKWKMAQTRYWKGLTQDILFYRKNLTWPQKMFWFLSIRCCIFSSEIELSAKPSKPFSGMCHHLLLLAWSFMVPDTLDGAPSFLLYVTVTMIGSTMGLKSLSSTLSYIYRHVIGMQ